MLTLIAEKITIAGQDIKGPLSSGFNTPASVINIVMRKFLIPLVVIILLLVFISGGYDFLLSAGNPEKMKSAQAKLTAGIIGFILLVSAYFISKFVAQIFGIS